MKQQLKRGDLPLWSTCLGNLFEHYDTALFGFLSPFIAPLMFPEKEPITALMLTYAIIPLGMLARPFGALVFGTIGDLYGREYALFLTLVGMSFVSGCIAFTPTYAQIGLFAPLIFCFGRALQNFFGAGETMGGAIFLLENTPEKQHDFISSLYNASTMGGHLLASFGVFLLSHYHFINPGWRLLYLCGSVTALFGCMVLPRSPFPLKKSSTINYLETFKNLKNTFLICRKPFLSIVICSGFGSACYSVALVLMNGFIPLISTVTKLEMMRVNTYLLVVDFCALPFFGWIASKIPREKVMLSASLGVTFLSIPLLSLLEGASLPAIILIRLSFVIFGVAFFASFQAWAQQLVAPHHRYTVISLGYALGSQALGGPTAALALWSFQKTGIVASVGWYFAFLGLISSVVIIKELTQSKRIDLMSS